MSTKERKEYNKNYYLQHKEELLKRASEYAITHKLQKQKYDKEYYKENVEKKKKNRLFYYNNHKEQCDKTIKEHREEIRRQIFGLLGNKCSNLNCPIPIEKLDKRCLQVDHIHGGGTKEKRKIGGWKMYKRVLKYPEEYQLLCAYCNWLKRYEKREVRK